MNPVLEQDPEIDEIYPLRNIFKYWSEATVTGICMGAAALWCKYALEGSDESYEERVHEGENLRKAKRITSTYNFRANPLYEITTGLRGHIGRGHFDRRKYERIRIFEIIERSYKQKWPKVPYDYYGSMEMVLAVAGIVGTVIRHADINASTVVDYICDHPGIYLIVASNHYMAASSIRGHFYFLDNENGLYKCTTKEKLKKTIKELRTKWIREEGEKSETVGGEWGSGEWYCARCTG